MSAAASVRVSELETANVLREALERSNAPHYLLGSTTDAPRQFFCFDVETEGTPLAKVGVLSAGIGVEPRALLTGGHLLVGYNSQVAVLDLAPPQLRREIDLLSLFWVFLDSGGLGHVCVLCETALIALSPEGDVRWRVDTDLIVDFSVDGQMVSLQLDDAPPMRVDLRDGTVLGR